MKWLNFFASLIKQVNYVIMQGEFNDHYLCNGDIYVFLRHQSSINRYLISLVSPNILTLIVLLFRIKIDRNRHKNVSFSCKDIRKNI